MFLRTCYTSYMDDNFTGIVVRSADYKENDVILTVLTAKYGLVSLYAKGCRKITSKNAGATQLFDKSEFLADYKPKEMGLLKSARLLKEFPFIRADYERILMASLMAELAASTEDDGMYPLIDAGLRNLNTNPSSELVLNIYLSEYVKLLGLMPEVDHCVVCGSQKNIVTISPTEGGFVCEACNEQVREPRLGLNTLKAFRYVNKASFAVIDKTQGLGLEDFGLTDRLMAIIKEGLGYEPKTYTALRKELKADWDYQN